MWHLPWATRPLDLDARTLHYHQPYVHCEFKAHFLKILHTFFSSGLPYQLRRKEASVKYLLASSHIIEQLGWFGRHLQRPSNPIPCLRQGHPYLNHKLKLLLELPWTPTLNRDRTPEPATEANLGSQHLVSIKHGQSHAVSFPAKWLEKPVGALVTGRSFADSCLPPTCLVGNPPAWEAKGVPTSGRTHVAGEREGKVAEGEAPSLGRATGAKAPGAGSSTLLQHCQVYSNYLIYIALHLDSRHPLTNF